MAKRTKRVNPFYVLLVLIGVAFVITACAYGVMAVKELHQADYPLTGFDEPAGPPASDTGFLQLMNTHGERLLLVELVLLGITTFAAIGTDRFWAGDETS